MASVEIDVEDYLDEASASSLARELKSRIKGGDKVEKEVVDLLFECDEAMETALWRWRRGDVEDALFYLETALGKNWTGLSDILRRRAA